MSQDRRHAERRVETFPVTVTIAAPIELTGQTLNMSRSGLLLSAQGKIPVILGIKGKQYRGELVRAGQSDDGTSTAYAIRLIELLEE